MGEISEALRRARQDREAVAHEPSAREVTELGGPARRASPVQAPPVPIDRTQSEGWPARAVLAKGQRGVAEGFRQLAVRVEQELAGRNQKALLVCSGQRQEGKTLTSCNLALALASLSAGRRIALVDLDLRKPSVARALGIEAGVGVERVLRDDLPIAGAKIATDLESLDVYAADRPDRDAHTLLSTAAFTRMIRDLEESYSTIIFDTPPILLVPDVALIAPRIGACLLVARAGSTRRKAIHDALRPLPPEALIGVFLNDARARGGRLRYYADYYGEEDDEARDRLEEDLHG